MDFGINKDESMRPLEGYTYWVRAFGCQMNESDAESVAGMLEEAGALPVMTLDEADIAVYLTCCVRERADVRLKGQVASIKNVPNAHDSKRIICIGGCIGQRDAELLLEDLPHVDVVFGTHNLSHLIDLIQSRIESGKPQVEVIEENDGFASDLPRRRENPWHAWVPIMTGCNNFCTYCIVPYVRGRERSRTLEDIERELGTLASSGIQELTLLGQNVNSYGRDLYGEPRFDEVLHLAGRCGVSRVRFVTSHPKDLSAQTIEAMAAYDSIMPQLHLPLQSGSDRILKAMNRVYDTDQYRKLVSDLKEAVPELSLSTDIIIGFPGETEDDFIRTCEMCEEIGYNQMFRFIYSKRAGTPAALMPDDTPREVLQERFERLEKIAQKSSLEQNEKELGKTVSVLVEGTSKRDSNTFVGKSPKNQTVHAPLGTLNIEDVIGTFVDVSIDKATSNYLSGSVL